MTTATPSIALYWDFENIERAVRDGGSARVDIDAVVEHARSLGPMAVHRAYANWAAFGRYAEALQRHAIELVQLFPLRTYREGERAKNGADVRMAVDAIDDLHRFPHLALIVVATGDGDFVGLAQKARSMGRSVHGTGVGRSVNPRWVAACDAFTYYEDLLPKQSAAPVAVERAVTADFTSSTVVRPLRPAAAPSNDVSAWQQRLKDCGWKLVTPSALVATVDAFAELVAAAKILEPELPFHKAVLGPLNGLLQDRGLDPSEARRIVTVLYKAGLAPVTQHSEQVVRTAALERIARAAIDRLQPQFTVEPARLGRLLFGDDADGLDACSKAHGNAQVSATAS